MASRSLIVLPDDAATPILDAIGKARKFHRQQPGPRPHPREVDGPRRLDGVHRVANGMRACGACDSNAARLSPRGASMALTPTQRIPFERLDLVP